MPICRLQGFPVMQANSSRLKMAPGLQPCPPPPHPLPAKSRRYFLHRNNECGRLLSFRHQSTTIPLRHIFSHRPQLLDCTPPLFCRPEMHDRSCNIPIRCNGPTRIISRFESHFLDGFDVLRADMIIYDVSIWHIYEVGGNQFVARVNMPTLMQSSTHRSISSWPSQGRGLAGE